MDSEDEWCLLYDEDSGCVTEVRVNTPLKSIIHKIRPDININYAAAI